MIKNGPKSSYEMLEKKLRIKLSSKKKIKKKDRIYITKEEFFRTTQEIIDLINISREELREDIWELKEIILGLRAEVSNSLQNHDKRITDLGR